MGTQETIVERLYASQNLKDTEFEILLQTDEYDARLIQLANLVRRQVYGTDVYIRGLIELSNYCKNNCYYCGIRYDNAKLTRYRLSKEEILFCCDTGYGLGFRTFVLQGGEDPYFTDTRMCDIISTIKARYGDCAVTISLGERSRDSYKDLFTAGADRYLLRHETANPAHYRLLHPSSMSLENRKNCLRNLKKIGYQVGAGFMVDSPYQTLKNIVEDLRFLQELKPAMIGIGPYLTHSDTPFKDFKNGRLKLCLRLIAILRLMFPYALIPATTALGTLAPDGREQGLLSGANVVMPNLSPVNLRRMYSLYDNKICVDECAQHCKMCLELRVSASGYQIAVGRGDAKQETPAAKTFPVPDMDAHGSASSAACLT
jgi:biotin synthase